MAERRRRKSDEYESEGEHTEPALSEYESTADESRHTETEETEEDSDEYETEEEVTAEEETDEETTKAGPVVEGEKRQSGDGEQAKLDDDEDKQNPAYIPRRGAFYEHDMRLDPDDPAAAPPESDDKRGKGKLWKDDSKWGHDKFDPYQQSPKSRQELIALYGYDITLDEKPPENPPKSFGRSRRGGRNNKPQFRDFLPEDDRVRKTGYGEPDLGSTQGEGYRDEYPAPSRSDSYYTREPSGRRGQGRGFQGNRGFRGSQNQRNRTSSGENDFSNQQSSNEHYESRDSWENNRNREGPDNRNRGGPDNRNRGVSDYQNRGVSDNQNRGVPDNQNRGGPGNQNRGGPDKFRREGMHNQDWEGPNNRNREGQDSYETEDSLRNRGRGRGRPFPKRGRDNFQPRNDFDDAQEYPDKGLSRGQGTRNVVSDNYGNENVTRYEQNKWGSPGYDRQNSGGQKVNKDLPALESPRGGKERVGFRGKARNEDSRGFRGEKTESAQEDRGVVKSYTDRVSEKAYEKPSPKSYYTLSATDDEKLLDEDYAQNVGGGVQASIKDMNVTVTGDRRTFGKEAEGPHVPSGGQKRGQERHHGPAVHDNRHDQSTHGQPRTHQPSLPPRLQQQQQQQQQERNKRQKPPQPPPPPLEVPAEKPDFSQGRSHKRYSTQRQRQGQEGPQGYVEPLIAQPPLPTQPVVMNPAMQHKMQHPPVQTVSMPMTRPALPPQPLMGHMAGPPPRVPYGHVPAPRGPIVQSPLSMPQAVSAMGPQVVHAPPGAVFATPAGSLHAPTTAVLAGPQLITAPGLAPPGAMIYAPPPFQVPVPQFSTNVQTPQTPGETVLGGTTYYVSTTASSPTTGTTYYSPEMQLSNSHRVPTRRPKAPLPIVNPELKSLDSEDVKKDKDKSEQVKEPELSNQINNQMSESVESVEEKTEDPLAVNEADEDVAKSEADIDQSDENSFDVDNEIHLGENTDDEEFYESTDQIEIKEDNTEELGAMQAVEHDTIEELDIMNESFDGLGEETDLDRFNEMESIIEINKEDNEISKKVHEETEDVGDISSSVNDHPTNGETEEVTESKQTRTVEIKTDTILHERKGHVFDVETATPTLSVSTSVGELKHDLQAIPKLAERKEVTEEFNKEGDTLQTDG
ncbi:serine/arginine repetitive matrix protein 1-like isoform X2 [Dreissena polymorpha]|uniref:serine/arginine repetitive matrix protein 1-like isoform X2 n=1 Tax=Dreissena polymorpha TaxID=45954 RepID=UPI00226521E9|nr:serine/arginine repetitive matrix protein 1-like isoform X2 [Dreissena polymorpha]